MEFSPLDIRSQKFSRKLKGYDVTEVDSFLEAVAKDMEKLYSEYYGLKEELVKKNQEIIDYKEKDKSISEAILMVQSVAEDIKKAAETEAEAARKVAYSEAKSIKEKAESEVEEIVGSARKKQLKILDNIEELLNNRSIILNAVKNILATNLEIINRESEKDSSFFDVSVRKPKESNESESKSKSAMPKNKNIDENVNQPAPYLADFMTAKISESKTGLIPGQTDDNGGEFSF